MFDLNNLELEKTSSMNRNLFIYDYMVSGDSRLYFFLSGNVHTDVESFFVNSDMYPLSSEELNRKYFGLLSSPICTNLGTATGESNRLAKVYKTDYTKIQ